LKHTLKVLSAAAVAIVALGLAGCSASADPGESASSSGTDYVPVQVGVGSDAAYAPFFIADQEGLFAKAGLDVTLTPFASGGDALTALGAGQIDLTMSSPATITSTIANNPKITAFVQTVGLGRYNKVVLRNGVDSAKDIKTFGYVAGLSQYMAYNYLKSQDIDPDTINWVPAGAADLPALLQRGDIDGFVLWQPWPTNVTTAGTGHVVALADDIPGVKLVNWLATTHDWIDANDSTAKALVKVLGDAMDIVKQDPDAAANAVQTAVAIDAKAAAGMLDEMDFGLAPITSDDVTSTLKIGDFFVSTGAIAKTPDLKSDLVLNWSWN
jgi:NitT/TauT family transport system substrate-binding protein